jgi:hypothetical protein
VSEAVAHLSPDRALRLVAASPGGTAKTARDLRREGKLFEQDAERRDRLAVSSLAGNRRKARQLAKARKAEEQRANAKVCALAAAEVDRRKVGTVGHALRNPVARFFLRRLGWDWGAAAVAQARAELDELTKVVRRG